MTTPQLPRWFRMANRILTPLIKTPLPIGAKNAPMALLTVPGRKTGVPRTTPVALAARDDGWLLISVNGVTDWSRNLRAGGSATVSTRGKTVNVSARELPPAEAAPILRDSMAEAPALVRTLTGGHFESEHDSPIEVWQRDAATHPVFILTPN